LLILDETGKIKTNGDLFSSEETLNIFHMDLKEPDAISKFYDESSYSKPISIGNMTIPVHICGQEIKEPFQFIDIPDSPLLTTIKEIDKSFYDDYRWQVVFF